MTALVAGHETTASQLAWAFERLAREPRVAGRLADEIDAGESDEYLTATINEMLRLEPVLPNAEPRLTKQPVTDRRLRVSRRGRAAGQRLPRPPRPGDLSRAQRVPARALPRRRAGHLYVAAVRRRPAAMPRRELRAPGDEDRPPRRVQPLRGCALARPGRRSTEPTGRRSITFSPRRRGRERAPARATRSRRRERRYAVDARLPALPPPVSAATARPYRAWRRRPWGRLRRGPPPPRARIRPAPAATPLAGVSRRGGQEVRRRPGREPRGARRLLLLLLAVPAAARVRRRSSGSCCRATRAPSARSSTPCSASSRSSAIRSRSTPLTRAGAGARDRAPDRRCWAGLGVTQAAQNALDHVWAVPFKHRPTSCTRGCAASRCWSRSGALFLIAPRASGLVTGGSAGRR